MRELERFCSLFEHSQYFLCRSTVKFPSSLVQYAEDALKEALRTRCFSMDMTWLLHVRSHYFLHNDMTLCNRKNVIMQIVHFLCHYLKIITKLGEFYSIRKLFNHPDESSKLKVDYENIMCYSSHQFIPHIWMV